ncbi:hypothetical protein NW752_001254 [Fusarium irregulare]|uniref:CBM-cenC domain-containing protein n=1 Tax=Fusarium irregulare TaxID=2494466 RepID=A0A9W8U4V3_9HYPO|nr:hypothetical protein NW766_010834 [Fusarium irregulare]KAJ4026315.1 hypothetical protein NW752_001254 [Fusarium irregulare]
MKLRLRTFQLLALCQLVNASPCKPPGSSGTTGNVPTEHPTTVEPVTVSETASLLSSVSIEAEIMTTEIATTLEVTTASDTVTETEVTTTETTAMSEDTTTATSMGAVSSGTMTTVEAGLTSETSTFESEIDTAITQSIATSEAITTSDMAIAPTTSAEPIATTSSVPKIPINLLSNPGFEDSTLSPWTTSSGAGQMQLDTYRYRTGAQCAAISGSGSIGFKQAIDPSLLKAGNQYEFSAYTKHETQVGCGTRRISCNSGSSTVNTALHVVMDGYLEWIPMTVICVWTQDQLNAGPSVSVSQSCSLLTLYLDDASLVEAM